MKKILSVLLLTFALTLVSHGQYYTGAYYTTKAPVPADRESGPLDVYLYEDGTCDVDIYFDGEFRFTAIGTFLFTSKGTKLSAVHHFNGYQITFTGTHRFGLFTGTFTAIGPDTSKGKWQGTLQDEPLTSKRAPRSKPTIKL